MWRGSCLEGEFGIGFNSITSSGFMDSTPATGIYFSVGARCLNCIIKCIVEEKMAASKRVLQPKIASRVYPPMIALRMTLMQWAITKTPMTPAEKFLNDMNLVHIYPEADIASCWIASGSKASNMEIPLLFVG